MLLTVARSDWTRKQEDVMEVKDERLEFIRRAAIALAVSMVGRLSAVDIPESAWGLAKEMWDNKPEDC